MAFIEWLLAFYILSSPHPLRDYYDRHGRELDSELGTLDARGLHGGAPTSSDPAKSGRQAMLFYIFRRKNSYDFVPEPGRSLFLALIALRRGIISLYRLLYGQTPPSFNANGDSP